MTICNDLLDRACDNHANLSVWSRIELCCIEILIDLKEVGQTFKPIEESQPRANGLNL